jgi:hypothetical protein
MRFLFRLVFLIFLLAGCATGPKAPPPMPTGPAVVEGEAEPAYSALASGDYARAAALFRELASGAKPPKKQEYQLGVAEAYINAEQLPEAGQALSEVTPKGMAARDNFRLQLLQARLALKKRDADTALAVTMRPVVALTEPALWSEYHLLRGLAYAQIGNPLESAREYALRGQFLADQAMALANQRAIMEALSQISEPVLLALQTAPPPDMFSGWMELARIGKSRENAVALETLLSNWRFKYPQHPAREEIFGALRERAHELSTPPSQIALLLPLTGSLHEAATAVRDGVLAAHYGSVDRARVRLRTYDIGADPNGVLAAYDQAVSDGAQFVIGPLRKEEVEALARRWELPVPVLALNNLEGSSTPARFYQFGLAPEAEARQVAERAWHDGHTHAAVVTPLGPWGTRVAQAFTDKWLELGGTVTASASYDPQENDYGAPLRNMLKLDDSDKRQRQIGNIVGRSLEFTPRRRQDVDFIFLAAFPRQARLLRPQIKFHHADDLPVFATSHLFSGSVSPEEDRDMDGAVFGDMPWVLEGLQPAALKRHQGQMARLVALGLDAYNVLPYLNLLENFPSERFEGATGTLQLDEQHRIGRQLAWARFTAGKPRLIELESVLPRPAGKN